MGQGAGQGCQRKPFVAPSKLRQSSVKALSKLKLWTAGARRGGMPEFLKHARRHRGHGKRRGMFVLSHITLCTAAHAPSLGQHVCPATHGLVNNRIHFCTQQLPGQHVCRIVTGFVNSRIRPIIRSAFLSGHTWPREQSYQPFAQQLPGQHVCHVRVLPHLAL